MFAKCAFLSVFESSACAIAGSVLKHAADTQSVALLGLSLLLYSVASLTLFIAYRSGAMSSFVGTTLIALLGTLIAVQCLGAIQGERFDWRVTLILSAALVSVSYLTTDDASAAAADAPEMIEEAE